MVSFLYKFISFFLKHSSSLHVSSSLVWKWCKRIQNSINPTRISQHHRKQISPYQRQNTEMSKKPESTEKPVAEPGLGFSRSQPRLQTHQAGVAAVLFITPGSYRALCPAPGLVPTSFSLWCSCRRSVCPRGLGRRNAPPRLGRNRHCGDWWELLTPVRAILLQQGFSHPRRDSCQSPWLLAGWATQ